MAWLEDTSGSLLLTTAEQDLATSTTGGTYLVYFDLNTMAAGDRIEFRVYVKPTTGDTERLLYGPADGGVFNDAQEAPMRVSVPVSVVASGSVRATLKQTNGTARTIPWWYLVSS